MTKRHLTVLAAALAAATSFAAQAQTKPIDTPRPYQPDPSRRVPPPPQATPVAPATPMTPAPGATAPLAQDQAGDASVPPPSPTYAAYRREYQGGVFIGAQYGRGEVYDGVDQDALMANVGYRWQAGAVSLLGIEVAAGQLDDERDDGFRYDGVDFASIGFNGRFNFGEGSPVFALVRTGYFNADSDAGDADGGFFGLGLGVDFNRHVNMSVTYTNYTYFDDLYYDDGEFYYDDLNRADTLMLGVEARF